MTESVLITVPDVLGLSAGPARTQMEQADLVPRFTGPPGARSEVAQQTPAAGTEVAPRSIVTMRMERRP